MLHRQLLLYSLVFVILISGYCISELEGPVEISNNNLFLRQAWFLRAIPFHKTRNVLVGLPTTCLANYYKNAEPQELESSSNSNNNSNSNSNDNIINNNITDVGTMLLAGVFHWSERSNLKFEFIGKDLFPEGAVAWSDENMTVGDLYGFGSTIFPNIVLPSLVAATMPPLRNSSSSSFSSSNSSSSSNGVPSTIQDLYEYLAVCEEVAGEMLEAVLDFARAVVTHNAGMLVTLKDMVEELTNRDSLIRKRCGNEASTASLPNEF